MAPHGNQCRGLFRTLKKDEMPYIRPFQHLPRQDRVAQREVQWGKIWQLADQAFEPSTLQALIYKGQQQAVELPTIHIHQVWQIIRKLPQKAAGLDGTGFDFLRELPYQAMTDVIALMQDIEQSGTIPNQWSASLIALLPKNADIERPIALVATLYRLWCRIRAGPTRQWQQQIQDTYVWERAVPGRECLQVALKRAFMTEHHHALKRIVISVLLDMSNFYDRISLEKLSQRWLDSDYPATHAALAMQIYCGPRILEAEGEASKPLRATHGILAGDPQAPLAAKIYLHKALHAFSKRYPQLHIDLWIDDLSFDIVDRDPGNAVRIAIAAFNYIRGLLEEDNLLISAKKTGFIVSNTTAKKLLLEQLPQQGPTVHDVMRDLGVDCTAGRPRRIATMKARRRKAGRKTKKLQSLKIPQRAIRLRLYKGSIVAGISWGHQAMGLAPQVRARHKAALARQLGLQKTGNTDIIFEMHKQHQDPDYGAFMEQVKTFQHFAGRWPESLRRDLEKAWNSHRERLDQATYPWQVARGPVAALQCYLRERGWAHEQFHECTKPACNGEEEFKITLSDHWLTIRDELKRAEQSDRLQRINKRSMLQDIQQPLDWQPWKRMARTLNKQNALALQTWHQGALFTKYSDSQEGKFLTCPHCNQPATAVHLMWLCKRTQRAFPALHPDDQFELGHGLNLEFWAQGLLQMPKLEQSTGGPSVQAWGTWTTHDEARIHHPDVVTIAVASTSTDARLEHFAVAIVHHTQIGGQLYRQGAVVAILPGKQTWERAWMYGLRMIAHYVDVRQRQVVHAQSTRAWQAWQHGQHKDSFHDIQTHVMHDQRMQIKALCINPKQLRELPKGEWTLRNRMADAAKAAREVALSHQPREQEQELALQDKKYQRIAPLAIQRVKYLLEDKSHFLHDAREQGKEKRTQAREHKRELYNSLSGQTRPDGHNWQPKGISQQCTLCKARLTMHSSTQDIEAGRTGICPQATSPPIIGGQASLSDKSQLIQSMVDGLAPNMAPHQFVVQKHYIVCARCGQRLLKNSSKGKLTELSLTACWNDPWPTPAS